MTKDMCIERLNKILEESKNAMYDYEIKSSDWEKNGISRTYFSIVETGTSKHYVKREYGYYDNNKEEYVAGKNDLTKNYTFSGSKF